MAVNWGLAQQPSGPLDILKAAGQLQLDRLTLQSTQRKADQEAQIAASRPQTQQALAAGNFAGAQTNALGAGDFDLAEHIDTLSKEHRAELERQAGVTGSLAYGLSQVPPDQRGAHFAAAVPALKSHGLDDDEIAHIGSDLSDNALSGYVNTAQSVTQQIAAYAASAKANGPTQVERELIAAGVQPGSPEWKDAILGHVNPSQFMQVGSDATGHSVIQTRGAGMGGGQSAPVGPQIEQTVGQMFPGAVTTSGQRSPQHNAEVGGVSNSYHLTDNARDVIPPKGVSMDQFHTQLKANLPGFDVINEGDHVHIEPGRQQGGGGPRVVYSTPAAPNGGNNAPSGYRWGLNGSLQPIPGGPADPAGAGNKNTTSNRKAEADLRKEFDKLPEVQNFRTVRTQGQQIRQLAKNPNAQNDIAMIFSYMKMLDPTSVVREGEFATAQNAAGVPDQIRNLFNRAQNGERLNPQQRLNMVQSADSIYSTQREIYNQRAQQFRGYAEDNGVEPNRVAQTYSNKKKSAPVDHGLPAGWKIERAN